MIAMKTAFRSVAFFLLTFALIPCQYCIAGESGLLFKKPLTMQYDIMYGGYKIGQADITQGNPYDYKNKKVTEIECRVEATSLIEHTGLYQSVVTENYQVLYLKSDNTTMGKRRIDEYTFDYDNGKIFQKTQLPAENKNADFVFDINDNDKQYFDMISMIFRLRDGLDTLQAPFVIPVFAWSRPDSIIIDSIDDEPVIVSDGSEVPAKKIKGRIPFATFPGAGEKFDIFISSDERRIPLKASLQMALGRIEILPRNTE